MKDVRFYVITTSGRHRLRTVHEVEALAIFNNDPFFKVHGLRLIKETREPVWERDLV